MTEYDQKATEIQKKKTSTQKPQDGPSKSKSTSTKSTKSTKYIFITGGVVSSLGKGIVASSLGLLLKSQGYSVTIQKYDPYLNVDPGTMSPTQHGEVFVTDDGCETDLDLGHYERFLNQDLSRVNNITSGMIFWGVLTKERQGFYLGNTVQIIPHVTNEIKFNIKKSLEKQHFDFVITEIGGTVGDIESQPFLEAIRQFEYENKGDCIHMHLTLVPYLPTSGEFKTKPTQHSVKELRSLGISPDVIVCRSESPLDREIKEKIALFCDVPADAVITSCDAQSIYDVPMILEQEGLDQVVLERLNMPQRHKNLTEWSAYTKAIHSPGKPHFRIGLVGKYNSLSDSYISVVEALRHAAAKHKVDIDLKWIEAERLESGDGQSFLEDLHGILIPGGFGDRGVEGKILAARFARENDIPYLGLCLGMHITIIEFARNVLHLFEANSTEFSDSTPYPVIDFLPTQKAMSQKGGTMRLGAFPCRIKPDTLLSEIYNKELIHERHRHRYEFNNEYKELFESQGAIFSGVSPDGNLMEVVELTKQTFHIACQYHPEFKSRPSHPHPLFDAFVKSIIKKKIS